MSTLLQEPEFLSALSQRLISIMAGENFEKVHSNDSWYLQIAKYGISMFKTSHNTKEKAIPNSFLAYST
jgi:hypothetical protein